MGTIFPKLSKLPMQVQEDILDKMTDSTVKSMAIGSNAEIKSGISLENFAKDGDVIEIDGMLYHCHPAISDLLNSLWEQIEGMKVSIKNLENAKN